MEKQLLIILVKNLIGGKVVSPFAKTLNHKKSLEVYKFFLKHTRNIAIPLPCEKIVYYSDFIPVIDEWQLVGFRQGLQKGANYGERIQNAFRDAFVGGFKQVVIIDSESFELTSRLIVKAFDELDKRDVVLAPCGYGGYCLIGMKELKNDFFKNKDWGSSSVFECTLKDLRELNLSYTLLTGLPDAIEDGKVSIGQ